jgi:replicative DNA helicase
LGGFRKSDLILIAGRPEMGATSLALNVVANTLRVRRAVIALKDEESAALPTIAMFSFDMSNEQVARRMLSADTAIPLWKISSGKFSESEWEKFVLAMQDYSSVPLLVAEGPMSIDQLCSEATNMKAKADLRCVVVDGLQRLTAWSSEGGEIANCDRIVRRLKMLASELSLPVIVTSSLPASVESRRPPEPKLADLSEYGAIERFSDVVLLLYREFHYLRENEPDLGTVDHAKWMEKAERAYAKAEILVGKNRNGSTARVSLVFDESVGVFQDLAAVEPQFEESEDR